jgi:hypothetical protein
MSSQLLQFELLTENLSNPHTLINRAITRYGGVNVCREIRTTPPSSPTEGECYIASAAWTGTGVPINHIACWTNGGWISIQGRNGITTNVAAFTSNSRMRYYDNQWQSESASGGAVNILATGTVTLDFGQVNILFYLINATGTRTMLPPANDMVPGRDYYLIVENTAGSSVTLNFASGDGWSGHGNGSVGNNNFVVVHMGHLNRPTVYSIVNAITPV